MIVRLLAGVLIAAMAITVGLVAASAGVGKPGFVIIAAAIGGVGGGIAALRYRTQRNRRYYH